MSDRPDDLHWMTMALELAVRGRGHVEPNPMVGCVVVRDGLCLSSGFHERYGGPHAEVRALSSLTTSDTRGSTIYVTLEPCSHFGKTPPCVDLVLAHEPARVVIAMQDPFPAVAGRGIAKLREHGIEVDIGVSETEARALNAPYLKRLATGRPWVHAKWAMTLDGAIATESGDSKWISNEASRQQVHVLRSQMDAIIVGIGTAIADDPLLTTRCTGVGNPTGRVALRMVIDPSARLPIESQLVRTANEVPVLVVVSEVAEPKKIATLLDRGCDVMRVEGDFRAYGLEAAIDQLGAKQATNVLIEGGGILLGAAFDRGLLDEVHCFIAPKILGATGSKRPIAGIEKSWMNQAIGLERIHHQRFGDDFYLNGRIAKSDTAGVHSTELSTFSS